jgi:hypothetical protein
MHGPIFLSPDRRRAQRRLAELFVDSKPPRKRDSLEAPWDAQTFTYRVTETEDGYVLAGYTDEELRRVA